MRKIIILSLLATVFGGLWAGGICTWPVIESELSDPPTRGDQKDCPIDLRLFAGLGCPGKPLFIVAFVRGHRPGQVIELTLPAGLRFVEGQSMCRTIIEPILPANFRLVGGQSVYRTIPAPNPQGYSEVKWRVIAAQAGEYTVTALTLHAEPRLEQVRVHDP